MSFRDIQIALDSRLATLAGGVAIAWENVEYRPVTGVPYLRPTLFSTESELFCLSDGNQVNNGIYRIDAIYPTGNGPGTMLAKLDAIYAHFKGDLVLTVGATNVWIRAINILPKTIVEGSWFMGSVDVNFVSYDGA